MATILAILCHGGVLLLLVFSGALDELKSPLTPLLLSGGEPRTEQDKDEPLQIDSLVEQLDRPEERTPEERRRQKEEEKRKPDGQVVDLARPVIEDRPDNAKYLSEYDIRVNRETKSKPGKGEAGSQTPAHPVLQQPSQEQKVAGLPGRPGPLAMRLPLPHGAPTEVHDFGPDGTLEHRPPGAPLPQEVQGGGRPGGKAQPSVIATPDILERALGLGPGSMDYLPDTDDGESTALNSKKWKYASFFNRVKRAVGDEWHPDTVYLRHDPSGNIYGVKDRVTVLRVHLQPDGRVGSIEVLKPSGVDFLDDEATSAFKRAQPFENPPQQLVEADGQIHFNFAFIFELSGHNSMRVFKY